jgi:ketosteroid isomerase-like protein
MRAIGWILLLAASGMTPPAVSADRAAELQQVVAAERAFAARAQVVNARQAFAEFFAPDAVLFAPFASPAFPRLREAPDWPVNIQWRPVAAAVSGAGDMGYTTGPSEYRQSPGEAPIGHGHYTSVWQRQPDGRFLVRIDVGIEHPAPVVRAPDWTPPAAPPLSAPALPEPERESAAQALRDLDAQLGRAASLDALAPMLAEEARWHRGGHLPVVGRGAVTSALAERAESLQWSPESAVIAVSGDFGYVYGRGRWQRGADSGDLAYLNLWQRRAGAWKLLVHVSNAVPAAPR